MNEVEIDYALSKQVPAMHYRVTLETDYGALTLEGRDAEKVAALVQKLLEAKRKKLAR